MENRPIRRKTTRAETIARLSISLTTVNPFERLKELASQGKYRYQFHWDKFDNGFMMEGKLYYFYRKKIRTLDKVTRWVETDDLLKAKNVISAVLLQKIGLGFEEEEEELTGEKLAEFGVKAVSGLLGQLTDITDGSWADQVEKNES